jgi:hypothetical protein
MKLLITTAFIFLFILPIQAQEACNQYFPFEHFRSMTFGSYDSRDRYEGSQTWEVQELKEENGEKIAVVHLIIREADGRRLMENIFTARCSVGTYYINMEATHLNQFSAQMTEGVDVEIKGDDISLPNQFHEGMNLPDARMDIVFRGMITINANMHIFNRKVDGRTSVSTPIGQLEAWKIAYDTTLRAGLSVRGSTIDYVAEKYGTVRTENYNRRGRLQSYSVLEEALSW